MSRDDSTDKPTGSKAGAGETLLTLLTIGAVLVLIAFGARQVMMGRSGQTATQGPNHELAGQAMPDIELPPLTNASAVSDAEARRGKVTLINFWGTWCPPCLLELPELVTLGKVLADEPKFEMILVSVGEPEVAALEETTAAFLNKRGWPRLATYHDIDGAARQQLAQQLGLPPGEVPLTLVIDADGVVRGVWQGYFHGAVDQMEQLVRELLAT